MASPATRFISASAASATTERHLLRSNSDAASPNEESDSEETSSVYDQEALVFGETSGAELKEEETDVVETCHRVFKGPFLISLVIEFVFCLLLSRSRALASSKASALDNLMPFNRHQLFHSVWAVFAVCLLARLFVLVLWRTGRPSFQRHRTCSSLFMAFGALQWVFYFSTYFWMYDMSTTVRSKTRISVDIINADSIRTDATNGASWRECMAFSKDNATACQHVKAARCQTIFAPGKENCVGDVRVGPDRCCIEERKSLFHIPMSLFGFGYVDVSTVFVFEKWLGILVLSWTLVDSPMAEYLGTKDFTTDVWLDILDAAVFGDYVLSDQVRFPSYGIAPDGASRPTSNLLMVSVWWTWIIGFLTSILSPILYTICVPAPDKSVPDTPSTDSLIDVRKKDLHDSLAQLDLRKAQEHVEKLIELQRQKYAEADQGDPQSVRVACLHPEMSDSGDSSESDTKWLAVTLKRGGLGIRRGHPTVGFRRAMALRKEGINYEVTYQDAKEPHQEMVPLQRIQPDLKSQAKLGLCGPGCCKGWLGCMPVWCRGSRREHYKQRATVIDAVRSLLLLEFPFLCWRLWLEWEDLSATSFVTLLIAKNAFWCIMDLLTILACGDDTPRMCFFEPLRTVKALVAGSKLSSIWVGPAGVFMLAGQLASKAVADTLQDTRNKLSAYRAWLQVEKFRARGEGNRADGRQFDDRLREVDELIRLQDGRIAMAHM
ncbi:unnamed protein product [Polarella glacialis]|uniref:Uncharacterized protein n=1 Tax=Polarella glacialis TaxID=89957 RepID=A0A813FES4_POLGL|nr:unnamed protein product [Polarella glacialis]CAE8724311.1 unnamed protein product [Polarella glacialis]